MPAASSADWAAWRAAVAAAVRARAPSSCASAPSRAATAWSSSCAVADRCAWSERMRSWVARANRRAASAAPASDSAARAASTALSSAAAARARLATVSRASSVTSGAPRRTRSPGRTWTSTTGAMMRLAMAAVERARTMPPASNDEATGVSSARAIDTAVGGASASSCRAGAPQPADRTARATVASSVRVMIERWRMPTGVVVVPRSRMTAERAAQHRVAHDRVDGRRDALGVGVEHRARRAQHVVDARDARVETSRGRCAGSRAPGRPPRGRPPAARPPLRAGAAR